MASVYKFLPWVREGAVSIIDAQDTLDATMNARVLVEVNLQVNASPAVTRKVRLYGPGDVTGFDARQVVRTDPPHLTFDFEPNYFPAVEFDRPDFPWLFTPAAANVDQQLRPWICLVVVPKWEGITLEHDAGKPLPVLKISEDAGKELPPLEESWAWACAQVTGKPAGTQTLAGVISSSQERTVSRLVCPRQLEEKKTYYACVVPAFEAGRKAGLGLAVGDEEKLLPAWDANSDELSLPVYYYWEFGTGAAGDFESLVWLLEPRHLDDVKVGTRTLDAQTPGSGLPSAGMLGLAGALRPLRQDGPKLEDVPQGFQDALKTLLDSPEELSATDPNDDLAVAPPIYGHWHAARRTIPDAPEYWLRELNLDPRFRAAAGFGTRVIKDQQEQLMDSAWEQVGEIERANQLLRQAQLARSAGDAIHRHLRNVPAASLLQIAGPVHARVAFDTGTYAGKTVDYRVRESALPETVVSPTFRRLTRSNGPLMRRMGGGPEQAVSLIERLNGGEITAAPPRGTPDGTVTLAAVSDEAGRTRCFLNNRLQSGCFAAATDTALQVIEPTNAADRLFKEAALAHQRSMMEAHGLVGEPEPETVPDPLPLEDVRNTLLGGLDPELTVCARVEGRLVKPDSGWQNDDCLEPIMAAPEFPTPMYRALADLSQDLLLPGLEHVPTNTITLLETNRGFVEAYMVGLNHEMSRELLWREFPTDQRGTYFRQFWDLRGRVPPPAPGQLETLKDIRRIHEWGAREHLGDNPPQDGTSEQAVLLIRGDLLRRFPNATIYAIKAEWSITSGQPDKPRTPVSNPAPDEQQYPIFSGTLAPDITFLCFDLEPATAVGKATPAENEPGWFFVIQQQPTEPRHGLDASAPTTLTGRWDDLSWEAVETTERGYVQLKAPLKLKDEFDKVLFAPPTLSPDKDYAWSPSSNSAALAYITFQKPFRIAIHASDMLPL